MSNGIRWILRTGGNTLLRRGGGSYWVKDSCFRRLNRWRRETVFDLRLVKEKGEYNYHIYIYTTSYFDFFRLFVSFPLRSCISLCQHTSSQRCINLFLDILPRYFRGLFTRPASWFFHSRLSQFVLCDQRVPLPIPYRFLTKKFPLLSADCSTCHSFLFWNRSHYIETIRITYINTSF